MTDDRTLSVEQAQEKYLVDVRYAIHTTRAGRWRLFERQTGEDVGEYGSESEARNAVLAIDMRAMVRINYKKIIGGPKYEELMAIGLDAARNFARLHPGHIGAENAIRQLEDERKHKASLKRAGRREATVIDPDFTRQWPKGRCPTTRALR
jgi:hypothetical protein